MSGVLGLGSPWTRALFPGDTRKEAEAHIPAGFQINVTAVNGKPGPWRVIGYRVLADGEFVEVMREVVRRPQEAVAFMATRLSMLRCDECGDLLEADGSCPIHGQLDLEGQPEFNGAFKSW